MNLQEQNLQEQNLQEQNVEHTASTKPVLMSPQAHENILQQLISLYCELFNHDGFGEIRIEMRILRRGQKEVIFCCGKQYRYVLDCHQALANESVLKHLLKRDLLG